MSKNKIPSPLRVDLTDDMAGQSQFVETRIVEPQSGWSDSQVRFQLPKEGILDRDAFISFKVIAPTDDVYLPLWAGAASAISSARLMCGGVTLCTSPGWNHLHTLKQFFRTPHNRNEKQSKRMGSNTALMVDTNIAGDDGLWGADTNVDFCAAPTANSRHTTAGYKITTEADTTFEAQLFLEDLFPLLYQNNLPLFALDDPVSIVLDLQQELTRGDRSVAVEADWVRGTTYEDWKLHIDLTFFDDPIDTETTFDKLKKRLDGGQQLPFTDYAYILRNQEAATSGKQEVKTLLGLDHQVVRRIFVSTPQAPDYTNPPGSGNPLLGNYHSVGSHIQNTLQVTLNSQPYYPSPVQLDCNIQNQLSQVFKTPHKVCQPVQSAIGQVDAVAPFAYNPVFSQVTDKTMNGVAQTAQRGCAHYYGVPLIKTHANVLGAGTAVGRQPLLLELSDTRSNTPGNSLAKQQHIFAECERMLMMKNGKVLVSGA